MTRVAINGLGRIGRLAFRNLMETEGLEVVAINDLAPADNLAYLLRHDSVQAEPDVEIAATDGKLRFGAAEIELLSEEDPAQLPWKDRAVELVLECSGQFTKREEAARHLDAGAERVIISAPAKGEGADATICMGVNEEVFDPDRHAILSAASCTTNCLAPVVKVLNDRFGVETGFMTTIHAVTSSQALVDKPSSKWARGRSALQSIIPTTTGASTATELALPELKGKLDGVAFRVPVADGSVIDLVATLAADVTVDAVNDAFRDAAHSDRLKPILGVSEEPLVTSDIIGSPLSALVAADSTAVLGKRTANVIAFYDNEWGYARRLADLAAYVSQMQPAG